MRSASVAVKNLLKKKNDNSFMEVWQRFLPDVHLYYSLYIIFYTAKYVYEGEG